MIIGFILGVLTGVSAYFLCKKIFHKLYKKNLEDKAEKERQESIKEQIEAIIKY